MSLGPVLNSATDASSREGGVSLVRCHHLQLRALRRGAAGDAEGNRGRASGRFEPVYDDTRERTGEGAAVRRIVSGE